MAVQSTMLQLGTRAPQFDLANTHPSFGGDSVSLAGLPRHKGLLVAFWCNHCPYVIHIRDKFVELTTEYRDKGLETVAICANDEVNYPDDAPHKMTAAAAAYGYRFPYLHDPDQSVALAYKAACTPDFFLFDHADVLVYRGQFDDARPGNGKPVTGADLRAAIDGVLAGDSVPAEQRPSMGCGIKWKAGIEPDY